MPLSPIEVLRKVPLFSGLSDADLQAFADLTRERSYPKGSVIVFEDDPGDSLFLVAAGQVKVVLIAEDGREVILSVLGEGSFFGEMAVIDEEPRSAHVIAMEDSNLLVLRREDFQAQLKRSPEVAISLLKEISRRLRRADEKIGSLVLLDVNGRVAHLLLRMADDEGGDRITRKLTHHTIAQMIGSSRETVSRTMRNLVERGVIQVTRKDITLKDRHSLMLAARRSCARSRPGGDCAGSRGRSAAPTFPHAGNAIRGRRPDPGPGTDAMSETLRFWGTRGSIPTPGPQTARYGGNTPCVSLGERDDRLLILDAGSGIRPLGQALLDRRSSGIHAQILLSHTHWDHIQGLPFFKPLIAQGNAVTIYGAAQGSVHLEQILDRQMDPMVFPVPLRALGAELTIHEICEQRFEVDGWAVQPFRLRHPGTTLGFRLTPRSGGRDLAYVTDNELGDGGSYPVPPGWRAGLAERLRGVDTLIHDAMYSEDAIASRAGWGHSTPQQAVELAAECGARRLILFHHEPEHGDDVVDRLLADARRLARRLAPALVVDAAHEGMTVEL